MSAITTANNSQISGLTQTSIYSADIDDTAIPAASEAAIDFFQRLDEHDFRHVTFKDTLSSTAENDDMANFNVTVEATKRQGEDCFLVHATSNGFVHGVPCGTTITSYITKQLKTLYQEHREFVNLSFQPMDRRTTIEIQTDEYVINRVVVNGEDIAKKSKSFKVNDLPGFLSEGSNILLQRLLIRKGLPENFQAITLDSESRLCTVQFKPLETQSMVIKENIFDVFGIERTLYSLVDLPTTWQSYYTKDGHLASKVQVGSPVIMKMLDAPQEEEEDEDRAKPEFGKKPLIWEEDIQMHSKFLDRKEELKNGHSVYMQRHPELKALVADFLQFVLMRKPDDVLAFAAEYFASFSAKMPDTTAYAESAVPSAFPLSRSSTKMRQLAQSR